MSLLELQRRMAEDVRRPLAAGFAMQTVTEDGTLMEERAASYITPNPQLSSFERLEIYNRQYWFRVIGAVSEDFPAVNAVLGERRFDALVLAYLKEHASISWTLRDLGAKLPEFLEEHPELAGRRYRLAVDVARLEWAYVDAFDGERLEPLSLAELAGIGPESRFELQPHLRLLELSYPVEDLVLAVRRGTPETEMSSSASQERSGPAELRLPAMRRRTVYLAVHRYDDQVYYRRIGPEAFRLLGALQEGRTLAESLTAAFVGKTVSAGRQAQVVQECLAHASQLGWLCAPRVEERPA
ncbi:Putative DNA-binding domain-containing protein [Bryocella elongata]|uniref:Putative DNA-binding domain-containing protein n=1 Tax=Bryocella elongata TaxID=863522 RepID=A0A1H6C3A1_9BACT|nr:DNA-binding domain-containing protein [Bryocella elongata]SEG67480.1 Putative DNA-binding domain-containing protein [Bryocella elongata]